MNTDPSFKKYDSKALQSEIKNVIHYQLYLHHAQKIEDIFPFKAKIPAYSFNNKVLTENFSDTSVLQVYYLPCYENGGQVYYNYVLNQKHMQSKEEKGYFLDIHKPNEISSAEKELDQCREILKEVESFPKWEESNNYKGKKVRTNLLLSILYKQIANGNFSGLIKYLSSFESSLNKYSNFKKHEENLHILRSFIKQYEFDFQLFKNLSLENQELLIQLAEGFNTLEHSLYKFKTGKKLPSPLPEIAIYNNDGEAFSEIRRALRLSPQGKKGESNYEEKEILLHSGEKEQKLYVHLKKTPEEEIRTPFQIDIFLFKAPDGNQVLYASGDPSVTRSRYLFHSSNSQEMESLFGNHLEEIFLHLHETYPPEQHLNGAQNIFPHIEFVENGLLQEWEGHLNRNVQKTNPLPSLENTDNLKIRHYRNTLDAIEEFLSKKFPTHPILKKTEKISPLKKFHHMFNHSFIALKNTIENMDNIEEKFHFGEETLQTCMQEIQAIIDEADSSPVAEPTPIIQQRETKQNTAEETSSPALKEINPQNMLFFEDDILPSLANNIEYDSPFPIKPLFVEENKKLAS